MDTAQSSTAETNQAVSIPTIKAIVSNITHSDQCLQADIKIEEYISYIPSIQFSSQEEKNNYASDLYTIQEEERSLMYLNTKNCVSKTRNTKNSSPHGVYPMPPNLISSRFNLGERSQHL
ncbi:hypothetical protein NPIL_615401 [Nephila pilipes]|uniref:Uncharacterized protein n=1 Tax=Nephila pilipes TaxID=299642 RepID=A0A8X6TNL0_NEPPI|nr:hypothetical protein NPIL_615401 [Nephila pilipes]